ncbi:pol II transcription elongation factor [Coprinopsis sp. MPI-PUGE-AT-0042]|nr:pol II transcription elongation factor [Coprinopsis sp. MPI-PUGE-AT-0042]
MARSFSACSACSSSASSAFIRRSVSTRLSAARYPYAASETKNLDGEVDVELWKESPMMTATFSSTASSGPAQAPQTRQRQAVVVMGGGDIVVVSIDDEGSSVEGTFETGISAASWSPDDSLLAIVTGEKKLILMTSSFDVLSEGPLQPQEFGEDAPINFHGSLGKTAAQAPTNVKVGSSPDEDNAPRISWRGDGTYFVVSSLANADEHGLRRRTLRFPDSNTHLAWKPSGSLIAATQRFGGFDGAGAGKEGKARYPTLRWGYRIRELLWNSDSSILAIWAETTLGDIVQLWTIGNYHWYLKHEIVVPTSSPSVPGRFTTVQWHPESPFHLILTTPGEILQRHYELETFVSPSQQPNDSGLVAVLDGPKVLLTPFRTQNVPPPMSSHQLHINISALANGSPYKTKVPIHVAFSRAGDGMALLWEDGYSQLWSLNTRLGPGPGKVMNPEMIWEGNLPSSSGAQWRQATLHQEEEAKSWSIGVVGTLRSAEVDSFATFGLEDAKVEGSRVAPLSSRNCRIAGSAWPPYYETPEGKIFRHHENEEQLVAAFPQFCAHAQVVSLDHEDLPDPRLQRQLFYHRVRLCRVYLHSSRVEIRTSSRAPQQEITEKWVDRKLERGSRIVVAVPSNMALVLQMPRGNLETINPRPLVMQVVKQDLDTSSYRKATGIDFSEIVNHNEEAFLKGIPLFVDQIPEVDHLGVFLTLIGRGTNSPETVAKSLRGVDLKHNINAILTAHVVKSPPDYAAALNELHRLRETDPSVVEEAVKYVIFLVDAERLFDIALGMYDFSLVLMIAQHAQKDPREYLPFLRELRSLDKYYQRFRIDDHLKRYESALKNLAEAGPERFPEAMQYIERHNLYEVALKIWRGTDRYSAILELYGDWLYERKELAQAASAFLEANKPQKAMVAFERNLQWQELFDLALSSQTSDEGLVEMAYRVAEDLSSKKRHAEAGRVLLDYAKDFKGAVSAFSTGNDFSEARRVTNFYKRPELLEEIIHPAALDSCAQISEDLNEMREQLRKQRNRIKELRIRKIEEPDAFYGTEDVVMQNIDAMTDVSMAPTTFTRYTVAPSTAASRTTKKSSRSKRKAERKVSSGRKGTVDEEEYILKSLVKLTGRFTSSRDDARRLLPHLYQFTEEHREQGRDLQLDVNSFETELKEALEEVWTRSDEEGNPATDTWATRMAEVEKNRQMNPLDRVSKPDVKGDKWKIDLYEI